MDVIKHTIVFLCKEGFLETKVGVTLANSFDEGIQQFFDLCDEHGVGPYYYLCKNEVLRYIRGVWI